MLAASIIDNGAPGDTALQLTLTGAAVAVRRGHATPVPLSRLDAALLAVLAIEGATTRQRLLQLLWPGREPETGRNALRQRLFRLRRAAGADVVTGGELLSLTAGVAHDLDGDAGAELLAAHDYADGPDFERWLDAQRSALAGRRRARDVERIDACEGEGRYAEGAALAQRLVGADALDEAAVQRLMKLRYLDGQRAAAVDAFERFVAALQADQGGVPGPASTELLATIRAARAPLPLARRTIPASVLRPPRLIGRESERRGLLAAWSAGRVFWLLGEAGLGKTRLIGEFVAEAFAAHDAADTLVVPARPGDAGVPYASLGRALRALIEHRPALLDGSQRSELARVMPEIDRAVVAQIGLGQQLLHGAIEALIRDAQRAGLAAVVIDDLHFADNASLEMLQGLVLADSLAGLRWGFAQRPAEGAAALANLRGALEESQRIDVIALAPLDSAQIAELVGSLGLDGVDAARLAPLLARHTGGHPMYVLETLKHLIASGAGALAGELPRPANVGQLIERRLRQLTPQALALARVAAVAGVDFSIELAEAVLGTRALALTDAWRELEAAQVLRGNHFAHDLVHEATLAGLPAPIAAHTHGAVATFLELRGSEPARVAAHWLDAEQPQRALAALHAAADVAKRAMRRKEEAAFLARAAQIESEDCDSSAAFDSWYAMLNALWVADMKAMDAATFDRLEAVARSPRQRAAAHALRANWARENDDLDEAKRLARSAIALADAASDEATAADARQNLAIVLDWAGDYEGALALLQPLLPWAAEHAGDIEQAEFYCRLSALLDNIGRGPEARIYHRRAIDKMRKAEAWSGLVTLLGNLAISWTTAGYMERALEVLREALQLAAAHDEARGCGVVLAGEMYKSLRDLGRYAEALRWIEPALASEPGTRTAIMQCHAACGWMHLGQHARAQREINAALAARASDFVHAKALQMRARLALALGQRGAGVPLDEALQIIQSLNGRPAVRASIVLDHALTLEPAAALAAARGVVAEGERLDLPGTALSGHIRATRLAVDAGLAADADAHARAALAIGDDVAPNDLYPAECWLNASRALRLASHDSEADEVLRRGVQWVQSTLQTQVPEPFRRSFVRANPVNQQLLRAAARVNQGVL